jgi:replication factor A1
MVQEGDTVVIENGYTQAFRGDNSLNIGRYGKLRKA